MKVRFDIGRSPFGPYVLAVCNKKICALEFLSSSGERPARRVLERIFPNATLEHDTTFVRAFKDTLFEPAYAAHVPLLTHGTAFQRRVWSLLRHIPAGTTRTYADIARQLGSPRAARAVGAACGANTIGYLIPCHRVRPAVGGAGQYRWGTARKRAMLAREATMKSKQR